MAGERARLMLEFHLAAQIDHRLQPHVEKVLDVVFPSGREDRSARKTRGASGVKPPAGISSYTRPRSRTLKAPSRRMWRSNVAFHHGIPDFMKDSTICRCKMQIEQEDRQRSESGGSPISIPQSLPLLGHEELQADLHD